MIKYFFTKQFLGFVAVGGLAALINWLTRIVLSLWIPFSISVIIAYAVGMTVAFTLNSIFIFSKSEKRKGKQARDFIAVNLAFLPVVWITSITLEKWFQSIGIIYPQSLSHGIAVAIPALATFLIYKFFAFKDVGYK